MLRSDMGTVRAIRSVFAGQNAGVGFLGLEVHLAEFIVWIRQTGMTLLALVCFFDDL